ncbi:MAG TPA: glutathione S-transferase N-terminal domain-containing protein [Kofleriaceae bacterium]|jgi:glutathione S-transferase|nr:glutathione S-transferase N-terminal domain-containing protein [Kofleriaceae bacterium]
MPELLGLTFSPWTEKARWALDARGVAYAYRQYQPLIGEPALRVKLRRWNGIVSVPVMTLDDGRVLTDSADIARWADGHGRGPTMFPPGDDAAIAGFIDLSDRGLAAGRARSLIELREDLDGVMEMVPRNLRWLPGARQIARAGLGRTLRKYRGVRDVGEARAALAGVLDELRAALARAPAGEGAKTLLGRFTFADVAVAQVLAYVEPPAFGLRLGASTRRSFVDEVLRERYADLVAWRDALYEAYRPKPTPA